MRRPSILLVVLVLLAACGGGITTQQVFDQLRQAGLAANARSAPAADGPIGQCGERLEFDIPDAASGASGTIIVCSPPVAIDAFGNAVIYHSAGGSVTVLVTGAPEIAPRIGEEIRQIKE